MTVLVNTGVLGCVSYVGMIVSAVIRYLKGHPMNSVIAGACGYGILAITINNMFSFQQTMGMATLFVILGIGEAYAKKDLE